MNIAGGSRVSVEQVIQLLREISDVPISVAFDKKQHGDVQHTFADTSCAEQVLGYHPLVALDKGLAREFEQIVSLYTYAVA